jgi:hypothetical protein
MMPSTGTSTFWNIARPFRASMRAMSCGVETMTAPARDTCWAIVNCASPVPGGMSTIMMSNSPQETSRSICWRALITMGPRQIIGVSSGTRKPIDMHLMPKFSIGLRILPSGEAEGRPEIPSIRGIEGP